MNNFLEIAASPVSLDAKLKALAITLDKTLPELYNTVGAVEKQQGPKGDKGDKGDKGEKGDTGLRGADGTNGKDGINGKDGVDGNDGISIVDVYISADNSLVCVLSNGKELDAGPIELNSKTETLYSIASQTFSLDSLPLANASPKPTEVIVKQNNQWTRASWNQFTSWIGSIIDANNLLAENGDFLTTEDDLYLIEE